MSHVTLTWQEFQKESKEFLQLSKRLNDDDWEFFKKNENEGNTFLICKRKLQISVPNTKTSTMENSDETIFMMADKATTSVNTRKEVFLLEYHILYSISYQVPVLYLKIQRSDGSIVELEDVWHIFAANDEHIKTMTRSELLTILTQMEHPVLFKPYYAIHPCKTAELLAQTPQSGNRILTFISVMGPFVQLQLDNRYGLIEDVNNEELNK